MWQGWASRRMRKGANFKQFPGLTQAPRSRPVLMLQMFAYGQERSFAKRLLTRRMIQAPTSLGGHIQLLRLTSKQDRGEKFKNYLFTLFCSGRVVRVFDIASLASAGRGAKVASDNYPIPLVRRVRIEG